MGWVASKGYGPDHYEVSVLMDASRIKGALNSMTNATLVLNQQGSSRPWDSQS